MIKASKMNKTRLRMLQWSGVALEWWLPREKRTGCDSQCPNVERSDLDCHKLNIIWYSRKFMKMNTRQDKTRNNNNIRVHIVHSVFTTHWCNQSVKIIIRFSSRRTLMYSFIFISYINVCLDRRLCVFASSIPRCWCLSKASGIPLHSPRSVHRVGSLGEGIMTRWISWKV